MYCRRMDSVVSRTQAGFLGLKFYLNFSDFAKIHDLLNSSFSELEFMYCHYLLHLCIEVFYCYVLTFGVGTLYFSRVYLIAGCSVICQVL